MTKEPWGSDNEIYNRNTLRDNTDDWRAGSGALDLGSTSHETRNREGHSYMHRESFYMTGAPARARAPCAAAAALPCATHAIAIASPSDTHVPMRLGVCVVRGAAFEKWGAKLNA
jgi:hypothetical protein|eukprot:927024-Prymnesium_polylepis.2